MYEMLDGNVAENGPSLSVVGDSVTEGDDVTFSLRTFTMFNAIMVLSCKRGLVNNQRLEKSVKRQVLVSTSKSF